jgi:2-hydroxy fatty acid dioxygenase
MVAVARKSNNTEKDRFLLPTASGTPSCLVAHLANAAIFTVCVQSVLEFHDSVSAMAFYGVYHREPANQLIHFFGVPFILWTLLICSSHVVLSSRVVISGLPWIAPHHPSWALLWVILYSAFYLHIDVTGAMLFTPMIYFMYMTAIEWAVNDQRKYLQQNGTMHWMGTGRLLKYAVLVHILSWYLQIHPGHHIIEGAAPASLANLGGALTSAPLFAFYEGVWFLGFRKQFQQKVLERVGTYTQELCVQGARIRVCESL